MPATLKQAGAALNFHVLNLRDLMEDADEVPLATGENNDLHYDGCSPGGRSGQAGASQPLQDLEAAFAVRVDVFVTGRREPGHATLVYGQPLARIL
jgi:hypothetical protein